MSILLGLIIFQFLYLLKIYDAVYVGDSVTRMKIKLIHLDQELVLDAIRNVQRVEHIKDQYTVSPVYDTAEVLYKIRSKFARMIRLLTLSYDNLIVYKHNKHIEHLSEIQKLALEIYALVEALEESEAASSNRKTKRPKYTRTSPGNFSGPSPPTPPRKLRRGNMWYSIKPFENRKKRINIFSYGDGFDSDSYI